MHYYTNHVWEQGRRAVNEDSIAIMNLRIAGKPVLFAAVCDGIGGLSEGETASSYTTYQLKLAFESCILSGVRRLSVIRNHILRSIYSTHHNLISYGKSKNIELGTTLSAVVLIGHLGMIIHIGDSRVYKGSRLMTNDHTDSYGHVVRAVGCGRYRRPSLKRIYVRTGDVLTLCTDGCYKKNGDNISAITIKIM